MTELSGKEVPLVSFVVIAYNVEAYIQRCLRSVLAQVGAPFEVVVVDDASTDATRERIDEVAARDSRVRVVAKERNEGAHLARRTGAAHTRGRFVYFIDGDDELSLHALALMRGIVTSRQAEIYRLGCRVVSCGEESEASSVLVERALNREMGHVRDEEILLRAFGGLSGVRDSWSVVTCLYEGAFCRAAFAAMADVRMGYMEDAYEFFVLASRASRLENAPDLIAFTYYLGAGRSGYGFMALDVFCSRQREVHALVREVAAFAEADGRETLRFCAEWFERECLRTLSNEWTVRLQPADQVAAVPALAETWGIASTCTMLASPLMGRATWVLQDDARLSDQLFHAWRAEWDRLAAEAALPHEQEFADLAAAFTQVDARMAMRDAAARIDAEREAELVRAAETRARRWYMRIANAFLPHGSRRRRVLAAAYRELRR